MWHQMLAVIYISYSCFILSLLFRNTNVYILLIITFPSKDLFFFASFYINLFVCYKSHPHIRKHFYNFNHKPEQVRRRSFVISLLISRGRSIRPSVRPSVIFGLPLSFCGILCRCGLVGYVGVGCCCTMVL